MKKGDILVFVCGKNKFQRTIKKASHFKTISLMLKIYKVKDINPRYKDEKELRRMYDSFPGYKEKIKKSGLVALEI